MTRIIARGPDVRLPQFKGRLQVIRTRGGFAVRGPQVNRPKQMHPAMVEGQAKFKEAAAAVHYMAPMFVRTAMLLTKGTNFLWRDVLFQALYGRGATVFDTDGNVWYAMASRDDMNTLLDVLSRVEGAMMYRGPDGWLPILPGNPGDILVIDLATGNPQWASPAEVSSATYAGYSQVGCSTTTVAGNFAAKGSRFTALQDLLALGIDYPNTCNSTAMTYRAELWTFTGSGASLVLDTLQASGTGAAPSGQTRDTTRIWYDTPAPLTAGLEYLSLVIRTDGVAASANPNIHASINSDFYSQNAPVRMTNGVYQKATLTPVSGMTTWTTLGGQQIFGLIAQNL
jgi:hypothetical protein